MAQNPALTTMTDCQNVNYTSSIDLQSKTMDSASASAVKAICLAAIVVLCFALEGCMYRILWQDASREKIRVVGNAPELYVVHVDTSYSVRNRYGMQQFDRVTDYQVPADGRVVVGIPAYRPNCDVYLFNWIKLWGGDGPVESWAISVTSGGRTVRRLPVKHVTDSDGYRLLSLP